MKRFEIKSIVIGIIIGAVGLTSVIAAETVLTATKTQVQVKSKGELFPLTNAVIITGENDGDAEQLYLSANEVFEYLGYDMNWKTDTSSIELTDKEIQAPMDIEINATDVLPPNGYIIIGQYTLLEGNTIQYNITAQGSGILQIGFIEPESNPHTANLRIFQQSNYNSGGYCTIMDSNDQKQRVITKDIEGTYSLFICNIGDKPLTNINGTIRINE